MEFTIDQVKALLPAEQAAKLDPAKLTYTAEECALVLKAATEAAAPPVPAAPALDMAKLAEAFGLAPAPAEESDLDKAYKLVAAAEAAKTAAPVTVGQLAEFGKSITDGVMEAVSKLAVEGFKTAPTRKGLTVERDATGRLQVPAESITAPAALREMDAETFTNSFASKISANARRAGEGYNLNVTAA